MTEPATRAALDGRGQPIQVVPHLTLGSFVIASPVAAPAVVVLYREGEPLVPVSDEAEQRAAVDHLLGQALLPGAPLTLETPDGELTLHRLLTLEVDGTTYDVMARAAGDARALVFERRGDDDLALVEDPAVVRKVQERAAATVSAFVGAAPEPTADEPTGDDAPPSLEEGQALLAELERLLDEIPPAYHPGPEYQRLARTARELREGLDRLRGAGPPRP